MKKLLAMAVAASALAVAAPASAQSWQSINQRQANLDHRIDVGVRNGSLTRNEAGAPARRVQRSGASRSALSLSNGLSRGERADLDRRFDRSEHAHPLERNDRQDRRLADRSTSASVSSMHASTPACATAQLSRAEAYRLRAEYGADARS